MNQEWADKKNKEFRKMIESDKKFILNEITRSPPTSISGGMNCFLHKILYKIR